VKIITFQVLVEGDFISRASCNYNIHFLLEFLIPKKLPLTLSTGGDFLWLVIQPARISGKKWGTVERGEHRENLSKGLPLPQRSVKFLTNCQKLLMGLTPTFPPFISPHGNEVYK